MTERKNRRAATAAPHEGSLVGDGMRRFLILLLGAGLLSMLWTAGRYWAGHPSLTLTPPKQTAAPAPESDGVGLLMQRLAKNPGDVEALTALARHFNHLGEAERAEMFALRAVMAAPDQAAPLHLLGVIQHGQGRNAEAAASLEKSLFLADDPSIRYSLGVLYLHYLNEQEKGLAQLQKILETPSAPAELKQHAAETLKEFTQ